MLKLRVTFVDDQVVNDELEALLELLKTNSNMINKSRVYKGRGESKYSNIYLELEVK